VQAAARSESHTIQVTIDHTVCTEVGLPGVRPAGSPEKVGRERMCGREVHQRAAEPTPDRKPEMDENGMKGSAS